MLRSLRTFLWTGLAARRLGSCRGRFTANGPCRFTRTTHLGENIHFNGMEIQGGGTVTIGDNFHSGPGCLIITSFHNYDSGRSIPYDDTYIHKDVTIEDNVWLGSRVIILGGVTIGEGAIIQAGAVVVKNIPSLSIAGGNPANVFKMRDAEHYHRCKSAKAFH
jgi:acetyltransferase-like isoleucine patch superfamily enzyme